MTLTRPVVPGSLRRVGDIPVSGLFIVAAVSQYLGAALGVFLFDTVDPATVAWLRAVSAGLVLVAWRRSWRTRWNRRTVSVATGFGVIAVLMNISFYEAIARIPLGTAVAIEFLGPLSVAIIGSRRPRDLLSAGLVAAGVALLVGVQFDVGLTGVLFALGAALLWSCYIVLGKRVADTGDGQDALAIGIAAAAMLFAPIILAHQLTLDSSVFTDSRTWLFGLGVGLLSSAVPYALDQVVLRGVGAARFALLLALLPATAAVVGTVALRQFPSYLEILGMVLVTCALVISAAPKQREEMGSVDVAEG